MVEYEFTAGYRPRVGPSSLCDRCTTQDCTNPIYSVTVTYPPFPGSAKERLYSTSKKPLEKRILRDHYAVLNCKGFSEKSELVKKINEHKK